MTDRFHAPADPAPAGPFPKRGAHAPSRPAEEWNAATTSTATLPRKPTKMTRTAQNRADMRTFRAITGSAGAELAFGRCDAVNGSGEEVRSQVDDEARPNSN